MTGVQTCALPILEKEIAILYCGVNGLLRNVPLDKVHDFERSFLETLAINHQADVLDILKTGLIDENVEKGIRETAELVAKQYT